MKIHFCLFLLLSPVTSFNGNRDILRFPRDTYSMRNISNKIIENQRIEENFTNDNTEVRNEQVGPLFVLLSIFILLLSSILFIVIWSYLNNVSTAKRCFLLYLFQDMIGIGVLTSWVWFGLIIGCYINGNGTTLPSIEAAIFSCTLMGLELGFGILASLCSMIKLYQMKENVIDIPTPWNAGEDKIMRGIRIIICSITSLFVSVMSLAGFHSHLYFYLVDDSISFSALPYGSIIFECLVGFFFAVPTFTFILDCCYRKTENNALKTQMERKFQCIICLMTFCAMVGGILAKLSPKFEDNILIIGELLVFIATVQVPLWTIHFSHPLKQYTKRMAFDFTSLITGGLQQCHFQIIILVRHCRRPTQIIPIE